MLFIKDFRELSAYKQLLNIHQSLLKEGLTYKELYEIRKDVSKVAGYIAQGEGSALYAGQSIEQLKKAIKWVNILDRNIRGTSLAEEKKQNYKSSLGQIRKILITLKNNLEVTGNEKCN